MPDLPPPPTHQAVAAALVRVAAGEAFLASVQPAEDDWITQRLDTVTGWQLAIVWRQGELGPLASAIDPVGRHWSYGCGRWPDWNAGPDAVVLDPIRHLLTEEQRLCLRLRLLQAICWPAVEPPARPDVPSLDECIDEWLWILQPS